MALKLLICTYVDIKDVKEPVSLGRSPLKNIIVVRGSFRSFGRSFQIWFEVELQTNTRPTGSFTSLVDIKNVASNINEYCEN